jgi:uncharacterized membrane protein
MQRQATSGFQMVLAGRIQGVFRDHRVRQAALVEQVLQARQVSLDLLASLVLLANQVQQEARV